MAEQIEYCELVKHDGIDYWCPDPWIRYYVDYKGYRPCHEALRTDTHSLSEYLNSPVLAKLKADLLNNEPNHICRKCNVHGPAGDYGSPRENEKRQVAHMFSSKEALKEQIKIVEIRFSNLCNIKCRQCDSTWSSAIGFEEGKKDAIITTPDSVTEDFKKVASGVEFLLIGGGEPLLHSQYFETLQYLIDIGRAKDVVIACSTNGTLNSFRAKPFAEYWKHFKQIILTVSIDSYGEQFDYWHHGANWDKVIANVDYYKSIENVTVDFHGAINWVTLFSALKAYKYIKDRYGNEILFNRFHPFWSKLDMSTMPTEMKPLAESKIREMQSISGDSYTGDIMKNRFENIIEYMYERDTSSLAVDCLREQLRLDAIRGTDFFKTFPEYKSLQTLV